MYRKGRPGCSLCIELKAENNNKPDCTKCGFINLEPENFLTIGIVEKYSGFFISGSGGINSQGIKVALDLEKIPEDDQPDLVQSIVLYLSTALRAQRG